MAEKRGRGKVAEEVYRLALPVVRELGLLLWDVDFYKEGAEYNLLVTIDRADGGIGLEDCEAVSRALSPLLDEADPIEESYCLEVSSAGLGRALTREEHFPPFVGQEIALRLYAPRDGKKAFSGTLLAYENGEVLLAAGEEKLSFRREEIAKCTVLDLE